MSTTDPPQHRERLLRELCAELDRKLREGLDCRCEDLLAEHPELSADEPSMLELIYSEYVARSESGETPDEAEFYERFPDLQAALQRQFAIHRIVVSAGEDAPPSQATPRIVGEYELLERVAQGAVGVVYRARHLRLDRIVAIKMLLAGAHAGNEQRERFEREANAIARLNHPHIVQLYELGEADHTRFLALEWIAGGSLSARLHGKLPRHEWSATLMEKVARAVHFAHEQGIVHRDLKPGNILLDGDEPKLTDFGLARLLVSDSAHTLTGEFKGTPCYAAPEQLKSARDATTAADVYSLGAVLYELLTGRPPFLAETPLETMRLALHEEPLAPQRLQSNVPRDLATICLRCLEKEPHSRYATAGQVADELARWRQHKPIQARPVSVVERGWKWTRRRPTAAALIAMLIFAPLALLASGVWYIDQLQHANRATMEQKADADRQRSLVELQLEQARRTLYAMQISQVDSLWERDPVRSLSLLQDPQRCPPDLREFSWHLFQHLCRRDEATLHDHARTVLDIAFAPDGRHFASASHDRTVRIWDRETRQAVRVLRGHTDYVQTLAISHNGIWLASAGDDTSIRLWRLDDPDAPAQVLTGHEGAIHDLDFSPDDLSLASAGRDGTVRIWNVQTGREEQRLEVNNRFADAVAFSPDGQSLLTASRRKVMVWELATGLVQHSWLAEGGVRQFRFSPNGEVVAVVQQEGGLAIHNAQNWERQMLLAVPNHRIASAAFSPDSRRLYTGGSDKLIHEWDLASGRQLSAVGAHADDIWGIDVSPDGTTLVTCGGDELVKIWDTRRYKNVPQPMLPDFKQPQTLAISPDGERMAVGGVDAAIWMWTRTSGDWHKFAQHRGPVLQLAFTPDGQRLCSAGSSGEVRIWQASDAQLLSTLPHEGSITALAISPDGKLLAAGGRARQLSYWDLTTLKRRAPTATTGEIWALAFTPDGKQLAIGLDDGTLLLRSLTTADAQRLQAFPEGHVMAIAFSADGSRCAIGSQTTSIKLWNVATWSAIATLDGHSLAVNHLAFAPDGRTLASATGTVGEVLPGEVKLWDGLEGQPLATFTQRQGPLLFLPDGSALITGGENWGLWRYQADDKSPVPAR